MGNIFHRHSGQLYILETQKSTQSGPLTTVLNFNAIQNIGHSNSKHDE